MAWRSRWSHVAAAPGYALAVLATVAMVVLVNAAAFAGLWAVLFKPLGYAEAERLVELRLDLRDINFQVGLSPSLFAAVQAQPDTFAAAIGSPEIGQPRLDASAQPWLVQRISADFTEVLGVQPALGSRLAADAAAIDERSLLLSDRAWRERFNADPAIVGRSLRLGGIEHRIVGVMPPGFAWPDTEVLAWKPWVASAEELAEDAQGGFGQFHVVARLAPGVSLTQGAQVLTQILSDSRNPFLRTAGDRVRVEARPWRERLSAAQLPALLMLQGAALLMLLVAAANLTSLILDRLWSARREYAIRSALGANAGDLWALIRSDTLWPASLGLGLGLFLLPAALKLLQARGLLPSSLPVAIGSDWATYGIGFLSATLVLAAGLLAARWMLRRGAASGGLGDRANTRGMDRIQRRTLVVQIALTTALVGASGLLLRSAHHLLGVERGFDATGVLLTQIEWPPSNDPGAAGGLRQLIDELRSQPGVSEVALADMPPFGGAEFLLSVAVSGSDQAVDARAPSVGPGYFRVMGMPLLAGRDFDDADLAADDAVIVDEAFRRRWLQPGNPIDQRIRLMEDDVPGRTLRVIGVVPSVKQQALDEREGRPSIYRPIAADPLIAFVVTRTALDARALAEQVRRTLARLAPDAKLMVNQPLAEAVDRTLQGRRALLEATMLYALATLGLAALGLYAVLNAGVRRRRAEFGVRMALGSAPARVLKLVLAQGAALLLPGVALGILLGLLLSSLFADRLFQLKATDPWTWSAAAVAIILAGILACALPALRAARVAPRVALEDAR